MAVGHAEAIHETAPCAAHCAVHNNRLVVDLSDRFEATETDQNLGGDGDDSAKKKQSKAQAKIKAKERERVQLLQVKQLYQCRVEL